MSRFWKYFHDSLNWPAIFSPGPVSAVVKGLALYMDDVREDILWLRRQWSPATADDEQVAKYGESRGIQRTRFDTDESYRLRVVNAYAWHKLGGKVRGLERIFSENQYQAQVLPSSKPELWAHFRLNLNVTDTGFDDQSGPLAFWLANEYKPARSVLEGLITTSTVPLESHTSIGLRSRTLSRGRLFFVPPEPPVLRVRTALALCGHTGMKNRLYFGQLSPQAIHQRPMMGTYGITSTRLCLHFPAPPLSLCSRSTGMALAGFTSTGVGLLPAVQE